MKVRAVFWQPIPCARQDTPKAYPSIAVAKYAFADYAAQCSRFGDTLPEGMIYPVDSDDPIYALSMTGRGTIRMTKC